MEYFNDNFIKKIGEAYLGFKIKNVMTMANRGLFHLVIMDQAMDGIKMLTENNLNHCYISIMWIKIMDHFNY